MNRNGFTLPLALLAMALMGALAGGVMLLARLRWLSGERSIESLEARAVAESEVERVQALWDPLRADTMMLGATVGIPAGIARPGISASDSLRRLGQGLFLVSAVGVRAASDGTVLARVGVASLLRLVAPHLPDSLAAAATGVVDVSGEGLIDGQDHVPAGWTGVCPAPTTSGLGVLAAAGAPVSVRCSSGSCISGSPAVGVDSTLTAGVLMRLGPLSLTEVVAAADHRVAGTLASVQAVTFGGACVLNDSLNWGDPGAISAPCGGFFPIVAAAPATRILSGQGQGVLVGTGTLELAGDAAFTGVVVATGPIHLRDRARIRGLVVALDSLIITDSAAIERSRCATARALRGSARPEKWVDRGWFLWE